MPFLTIFTPTYNRKETLEALYHSLCRQVDKNFIWLIVDDGSMDKTCDIVKKWAQTSDFQIQYVYQENSGKHVAHNKASELCQTDLFMCVDSDDILLPKAVSIIRHWWEKDRQSASSFVGYCAPRGRLVDGKNSGIKDWPQNDVLAPFIDLSRKYHYQGETALVWISSYLKKYRFPVFKDERFVTEIVLYFQISGDKPIKFKSDIFYLFEYRDDGYTKQGKRLFMNNPKGAAVGFAFMLLMYNGLKQLRKKAKLQAWVEVYHLQWDVLQRFIGKYNLTGVYKTHGILEFFFLFVLRKVYMIKIGRIYKNDYLPK